MYISLYTTILLHFRSSLQKNKHLKIPHIAEIDHQIEEKYQHFKKERWSANCWRSWDFGAALPLPATFHQSSGAPAPAPKNWSGAPGAAATVAPLRPALRILNVITFHRR